MSTTETVGDTTTASKSGSSEGKVEIVIDPQEQLADFSVNVPDNPSTSMALHGNPEEKKKETLATASSSYKVKDQETKIRHLQLYGAALNGDWNRAEEIFKNHPNDITAKISKVGSTALHITAAAESSTFALKLVDMMDSEHLALTNYDGNTAFCIAVMSGKIKLAKAMMKKNGNLAMIPGKNNKLPLYVAAWFGHSQIVTHLYNVTNQYLNEDDRIRLLVTLINTGLYDVALDLEQRYPELAIARDENWETALHALARIPVVSSNLADQNQRGILKRCFSLFSGTDMYCNKKLPQKALKLVEVLWKQVLFNLDGSEILEFTGRPWRLIFVAAEQGNVEFITILLREYPDLIFEVDDNSYTVFHYAVMNRHEDIFKLIYKIGSFKDLIAPYQDKSNNNILHLAGMLASSNRLNIVSGAALQMQRELLWFKEVSKIMHPLDAEAENEEKKTPRVLFTEQHEKLKENGEKWMKDTANSCMIVATLIATMVFAAAFTVPGGTKDDTGTPHFVRKTSFKIFVISDAISLVSSSCSILNFLSILTSRYAEEDFISVLPRKLIVGLATLLLSIPAMMVVFCATIFIVLKDGELWVPILVTLIASLPVILFTKQQWRLFLDVARSTYKCSYLFQPKKGTLFDEGKAKLSCDERCYSVELNCVYCVSTCWNHLKALVSFMSFLLIRFFKRCSQN